MTAPTKPSSSHTTLKMKVVGALGEPELFFDAVAEAEAGDTAGADGVEALQGLVGHLKKH